MVKYGMVSIYDFSDYRVFLNTWISSQKSGGHGLKRRLAETAKVSSSLISLILAGDKDLSLEQAQELSDFIGLNENESDHFFLLVQLSRAGSEKLRERLKTKIKASEERAKKISERVRKDMVLSEEVKSIYYSSWLYTGLRNYSAIGEPMDPQSLAARFNLPPQVLSRVVDFLVQNNLCIYKDGQLTYGPAQTHLEASSPHVLKHHQNWRSKGFTVMDRYNENDLFYTAPMSLSAEAAQEIRKMLPTFVEQVHKIMRPSPSEKVYCFNMDWFEY